MTGDADRTTLYYDPFDFEIDANPYPVWTRMRDEAPLYYNDRHDFFALSRFDDVQEALKDTATFSSKHGTILELIKAKVPLPAGMVIFEDPPTHTVYRGLLSRVFTPRKMTALEPVVRDLCAEYLDRFIGSDGFDVIGDMGAWLPMRVIGAFIGIPEADQRKLHELIDEGLQLADGSEMPDAHEVVRRNDEMQVALYTEYLDWRIANPSDDLMTELLNAEFEDHTGLTRKLTKDEALGYVRLLSAAGNETTTKLIGWFTKLLGEHPDQRRRLVDDRSLVAKAVEEVLRYETPTPALSRYVTRDVEYHGQTMPEGSAVVLLPASANRDERRFGPDAGEFDITRRIETHLAFAHGAHFCLGAALARMEGRVVLDEMLNRFPDWEVDMDGAEMIHTSTVRGWGKLPVVLP